MDHKKVVLIPDVQASISDRKLYAVRQTVTGVIQFIVTSFEELGIDKLHELVDPSLDELATVLEELSQEAKALTGDNESLKQAIHLAQIMVNDIKQKNPDLCAIGAKVLKTVQVG